jgi:hypothetical protein
MPLYGSNWPIPDKFRLSPKAEIHFLSFINDIDSVFLKKTKNNYARRAAAISFVLTHFVLLIPESFAACVISAYSSGDSRVEMNLPRFSFLGSAGLPTFSVSLIVSCPSLHLAETAFAAMLSILP